MDMFYNAVIVFYNNWFTKYGASHNNIFKRIYYKFIKIIWKLTAIILLKRMVCFKRTRLDFPDLIFEFGKMLETFAQTIGTEALGDLLSHLMDVWVNTDEDINPENPQCTSVRCRMHIDEETDAEVYSKLINKKMYTTVTIYKNGVQTITNYGAFDFYTKRMQSKIEKEFRKNIYRTTKELLFVLVNNLE